MLWIFTDITVAALAITVFCMVRITRKIVNPLKKLTLITGKYAKGDWDETFISNTGDEIQELSESISAMAATTKSYIHRLDQSAMTDELTGLKNKNCYLLYITRYTDVPGGEKREYGIVVFDINFLKKVNDTYGHEAGDLLIRTAGKYICDVFAHSPVFRIGGDEFCAVPERWRGL